MMYVYSYYGILCLFHATSHSYSIVGIQFALAVSHEYEIFKTLGDGAAATTAGATFLQKYKEHQICFVYIHPAWIWREKEREGEKEESTL